MSPKSKFSILLLLSLPLCAGIIFSSLTGLYTPDFYIRETPNWQAQAIGQDIMDLFLVVPVLLLGAFWGYKGSRTGLLVWGGANLYLIYTFCLYCFDVRFNHLFILYCFILGLSFYSFLYFIYLQIRQPVISSLSIRKVYKITGYYFILIALLFYALWLGELIPATMQGIIPKSLELTGLPTNGVHVIDLSVFLSGLFIVGIMLLRKKKLGFILAAVCLVFMVLMDLSLAGLMVVMKNRGLEANFVLSGIMIVLALVSLGLFSGLIKAMHKEPLARDIKG